MSDLPKTVEQLMQRQRERILFVLGRSGLQAVEKVAFQIELTFENGDYEYLDTAELLASGFDPNAVYKELVERLPGELGVTMDRPRSLRQQLLEMARCFEYSADAYVGPDAPFPDKQPSADDLCRYLQEMSLLVFKVVHLPHYLRQDDDGHWYAVPDRRLQQFDQLMASGWETWGPEDQQLINSCQIDHPFSLVVDPPEVKDD